MTTTFVAANTYTHTVTYIADKMLHSLQFIIRECGLSPARLVADWATLDSGIRTWLGTRDLESLTLEVSTPNRSLVGRWDFEIAYDYSPGGDGSMWVDTEAIRHAIRKAGTWPSECTYRVLADTKPGRPDVPGWGTTVYTSTEGFTRHSVGTTIAAGSLGAGAAYWKRN